MHLKILRKLNQQSVVPLDVGGEGEKEGKDAPQVLVWTLGRQPSHLYYKEEGFRDWRKEMSDVLNRGGGVMGL